MDHTLIKVKKHTIVLAGLLSLLIIPIGLTLIVHTEEFLTPTSNFLAIILGLVFIPLFLINLIFGKAYIYYKKWWKLLLVLLNVDILLFISNRIPNLSALANLGYIHMSMGDIIVRVMSLIACGTLLVMWTNKNVAAEDKEIAKLIIKTFFITQILIFTFAAVINLWVLG